MRNETTLDIAAPAPRIFELVHRPEQMRRWLEGLTELRYTSGAPCAVGSTFTQHVREAGIVAECAGEVTAFERERRFAVRLTHTRFVMELDFRLEPHDGGARLHYVVSTRVDAKRFRWLAGLFRTFTQRLIVRQARQLKSLAEQTDAVAHG